MLFFKHVSNCVSFLFFDIKVPVIHFNACRRGFKFFFFFIFNSRSQNATAVTEDNKT